jgi:ribonucleoside-diphosphate reductase alpha chain
LIEKYLVRNRATKEIYETPQVRYMVAAATVFHKEEPNTAVCVTSKNIIIVRAMAYLLLLHLCWLVLALPPNSFLVVCLSAADDDLDSIFASGEMMAKYAAKRAGIGLEVGRLRPWVPPFAVVKSCTLA